MNGAVILRYLENQLPAMIDLLGRLVNAESPSTDPDSQALVQSILTSELQSLGYRVTKYPGERFGGYLIAEQENRERQSGRQLLLGHSDTVWPRGTLDEMPFKVDGSLARGPGIFDMKGGLVQMLFALRALQEHDLESDLKPVVFINSDEEVGSIESEKHIRELCRKATRAYILEPAFGVEGKLKTARKGVGHFVVTITGRAAHAGLDPERGVSAISELADVIQALESLSRPVDGVYVNVGIVEGGTRSNVIASNSRAVVDVRVSTSTEARQITEQIMSISPKRKGAKIQIQGGVNRLPLERNPANSKLWSNAQQLADSLAIVLDEASVGGGSDGNITSEYIPTLDGLGAVGDGAHATHEYIRLDKMAERAALLALLLMA